MTHHIEGQDHYIVGLFRDENSVSCSIRDLERAGIRREDISLAQKGRQRAVGEGSVRSIGSESLLDSILNFFDPGSSVRDAIAKFGFPNELAQRYATGSTRAVSCSRQNVLGCARR